MFLKEKEMKMKSKALLLTLGLMSSSVFAGDYNTEINFNYFDEDTADVMGVNGTYYFDSVKTSGTAWAESAFMGRNSNVAAAYFDFDNGVTAAGVAAEFFGDKNNNLYASIGYVSFDADPNVIINFNGNIDVDDNVVVGEIGYFFDDNWLVSVATSDADDAVVTLNTKYVAELGGGQFLNLEASIDDESEDLAVKGDYYFTAQTSVGLELSQAEGFDYGINFQHFFTESVGVQVSYTATDFENVTGIALTARF